MLHRGSRSSTATSSLNPASAPKTNPIKFVFIRVHPWPITNRKGNSLETPSPLPASAHQSTIREVECSNMRIRHVLALCSLSSLFLIQPGASGQDDSKKKGQTQRETVAKPMSERQKKKNEEKLKQELVSPYKKWMNEEVTYIISDEERKAFKQLQT